MPTSVLRLACLLGLMALTCDSWAQTPSADVVPLGPIQFSSGRISLSRGLSHIGLVAESGSRTAVYIDGKPGATYDRIRTSTPVLSPDALHWAYVAQKGAFEFVVIDEKEYGPFEKVPSFQPYSGPPYDPYTDNVDQGRYNATPQQPIVFSPDGRHSAFVAYDKGNGIVFEDGKEIAFGTINQAINLQFSPQADHLFFITLNEKQESVVHSDKVTEGPFLGIRDAKFSADGKHLTYIAETEPLKYSIVRDGRAGSPFDVIDQLLISRDGGHVAYHASTDQKDIVVIDGRIIPNADKVWMTEDGAHTAYVKKTGQKDDESVTLVADGKEGQKYRQITGLTFAPDGKAVYAATALNGKVFVVDGQRESEGFDSVEFTSLLFSGDRRHFAYVASSGGAQFVELDDKKLKGFGTIESSSIFSSYKSPLLRFLPDGSILYQARQSGASLGCLMRNDERLGDIGIVSPDGRRIAVVKLAGQGGSSPTAQLTIDGIAGPVFHNITKMAFSPDSRHFAYVGVNQSMGLTGAVLIMDGVERARVGDAVRLEYSPDGEKLLLTTVGHTGGAHGQAYIDGVVIFDYAWLRGSIAAWTDNHHSLAIIADGFDGKLYLARYPAGTAGR